MSHTQIFVPFITRTGNQMGTFSDISNAIERTHHYLNPIVCRMSDHLDDTDTVLTANRVVNGDFPVNFNNWGTTGGTLDIVNASLRITNAGAAEGFTHHTMLATIVGQEYSLRFQVPTLGTSGSLGVDIGSTGLGTTDIASATFTDLVAEKTIEMKFTATTTATSLSFGTNSVVSGETQFIDEVEVHAIPSAAQLDGMALFVSKEFGAPWTKEGSNHNHVVHYTNIAGNDVPTNVSTLYPNFNYDPDTMTVRV